MFHLIDSGNATIGIIFYLTLVIFGSYFILNLILAVIMGSFTKFENQELTDKLQKEEQDELDRINNVNYNSNHS